MAYISITDGRIARYDSSEAPKELALDGFYTDSFSSCCIVMIYLKENELTRLSMIHADHSISNEDIQQELDWVKTIGNGDLLPFRIVRRHENGYSNSTKNRILENISDQAQDIHCHEEKLALSINIDSGDINFYDHRDIPKLYVHPKEHEFYAFYKLNNAFNPYEDGPSLEFTKIIFNSNQWNELSTHDQECLKDVQIYLNKFNTALNKLSGQSYIKNLEKELEEALNDDDPDEWLIENIRNELNAALNEKPLSLKKIFGMGKDLIKRSSHSYTITFSEDREMVAEQAFILLENGVDRLFKIILNAFCRKFELEEKNNLGYEEARTWILEQKEEHKEYFFGKFGFYMSICHHAYAEKPPLEQNIQENDISEEQKKSLFSCSC